MEHLIAAGADPNHLSSKHQATPLIFAPANCDIEIAMVLSKNGANPLQKLLSGEAIEKMLRNQGRDY